MPASAVPTDERAPTTPAVGGRGAERPALWRLPLIAFLVTGVVCLKYLDGRLASDYRRSAADLAVQADALIESAVANRAASVHTLRLLVADAAAAAEQQARVDVFSRALVDANPEVLTVYRLDERGEVRHAYPWDSASGGLATENHLLLAETAAAMARSRATRAPATTGVMVLRRDTLGLVIYDPIIVGDRLTGYVAAALAYGPLLRSLLSPRLQGRFGYRIVDGAGRVLAVSPRFPERVGELATHAVTLPGGGVWRIDVPVGLFQPRAARVAMWVVGAVLLFIVFLLVLREDARAERIAMHSFNLELLSRDLLDANVRLEERAQQVTEANTAKSRFLANVSHELRTPLNAIVGYNALALSGLYGEITSELRGAHERIRAAAEHLLRVVNDVLDLSKIEVGRMEVELRLVAIEPLLEDVVAIVEPVAEAKDVRIDVVVARDLPRVVTDARHVRQILMNLASNAIKFTERGSVTIVAKRLERSLAQRPGPRAGARAIADRDSVVIAVEDTGVGIASGDLERIFEEFEQVRPNGRGDSIERGTGLGLALSRKLARLLGGEVTADSHVGAGSRFTLVLPVEPPEQPDQSTARRQAQRKDKAADADASSEGRDREAGSAVTSGQVDAGRPP